MEITKFVSRLNEKELGELIIFCEMQQGRRNLARDEKEDSLDCDMNNDIHKYQPISLDVQDKRIEKKCISVRFIHDIADCDNMHAGVQKGDEIYSTYLINDYRIKKVYGGDADEVCDTDLHGYLYVKFGKEYCMHLRSIMIAIAESTVSNLKSYHLPSNLNCLSEAKDKTEEALKKGKVFEKKKK